MAKAAASGVGKSNDARATSGDQGSVEFTASTKAAEKKIDGGDEHGGVEGSRHTRSLVGDARHAEREHCLPVVQHWFLEPRLALQCGSNPVGAVKHFARHLRIAGFVGAKQAECPKSIEKKESAERRQQQQVGASSRIYFLVHSALAGR